MLATGAIRFGVLCGGIKRRLPGEMWTPRRLASERRMRTVGRSGRSDYRRSCGVSVGWKASRSLLIVQLRQWLVRFASSCPLVIFGRGGKRTFRLF